MTNDYAIVPPLMLATVIAYIMARRYEPGSLYSGWLRRRGEHLEHRTDRGVLAGLRVADAMETDVPVIHENASVFEMLERLGTAGHTDFPVVDDERRLTGIIGIGDSGRAAKDHRVLAPILVAADLAVPTETVSPDDSLLAAVRKLGLRGRATIPVVQPGTGILLGTTGRALILALYERTVARSPELDPSERRTASAL
jgi:CIC family chloride channel protein